MVLTPRCVSRGYVAFSNFQLPRHFRRYPLFSTHFCAINFDGDGSPKVRQGSAYNYTSNKVTWFLETRGLRIFEFGASIVSKWTLLKRGVIGLVLGVTKEEKRGRVRSLA